MCPLRVGSSHDRKNANSLNFADDATLYLGYGHHFMRQLAQAWMW
jgi:hypothetical protein